MSNKSEIISVKKLEVGDVIISEDLAFCCGDLGSLSFDDCLARMIKKDRELGDPQKFILLYKCNLSRGKARWLVVKNGDAPDSIGGGFQADYMPGYREIILKRLNDSGKYDPAGEEVAISPDNHVLCRLNSVSRVGKMKKMPAYFV